MPGDVLTLDLVANDQASPGIDKVADETARLSQEIAALVKITKRLDAVFKAQSGTTTRTVREQAALTAARAKLTNATAAQAAAERRLARDQAKSAAAASKGGIDERLTKIVTGLTGSLGSAVSQYGALGPVAAAAAVSVGLFGAAVDVTSTALKLQASLLVTAVSQALAFEQEITRVAAVTGEGAGAFDRLRQAALDGGASTLFTAQQAAEALRFLAASGLSADEAARALPGSLQLAAAGSLDLAQAADIATNVMNGFRLGIEGINRVNDILVLGANKSSTNVQELGIAFSYAAGIANSTGNDIESVAAVFGVLANNGIKASRAGTAVATGISRLQKPTPEAARALDALGVSLTNAEGKTKPLVQVLRELERAGATSRDVITIFGQVAGGKLITVLNTGTAKLDEFERQFRNSAGAAEEFQRVLQDTAQAQALIFQSTVETLSITIGSQFLPNVKGVSQALTEQGSILLKNNVVLGEFEDISDASAKTLANLLRISADLVPPFIQLGGAVLVLGENLQVFVKAAADGAAGASALVGSVGILTDAAGLAAAALGRFSDTQDASNKIAEEARKRLLAAADSVGEVDTAAVKGQRALLLAATAARRFAIEANLIEPPKRAFALAEVVARLKGNYEQASDAAERFLSLTGGQGAATQEVSPELVAQREIARLDAEIANSKDARKRAEIAYEKELFELKQQELDDEIRASKEAEALGKFESALLAAQEAGRKSAKKARKEDISGKLAELAISRELLTTDDARVRIQLTYQQALIRINASSDKEALKAAQRGVAELERERAILTLERERAGELRGLALQAREQEAALGQINALQLVALQQEAALAALRAEVGLDETVRAERERLILLEGQVKSAAAIRDLRATERSREASFTALSLAQLEGREDTESQIARVRLESAERLRAIEAEETDRITKNNRLLTERLQSEAQIAKLRTAELLGTTAAVRSGASAGFATDTSALQGLFASEAAADLERKVQALEIAKQAAELRGQDTTFLERRIEGLRTEAEAQRAVVEATLARVEANAQLAGGLTDLGTRLAEVASVGFNTAAGYEATAAALQTAAGLGGALAQGLGLSAKTAAKVQAAFNAAAAIGSFAAYAASGFTAANFLTSSIQYGIAAAKFGVIAGVSGGGGGRSGGGGAGGAGGGVSAPRYDAAAERDKTAAAFARALRDQLERPVQNVINIDQRGAVQLEQAPAVQRRIGQAVNTAQSSVYQSGRRSG